MAYSKLTFAAVGGPAISDANLNVITNGLDSAITYPTAGGTATALTLTAYHFTLTDGVAVSFVASASNSAAATTLNVNALGAKSVYKPGGTDAPNFTSGKYYTAIYNTAGDCFFVKANTSGNAAVTDVLATKTFSNDSDSDLVGTMPNNAGDVNAVSSHSGGSGTIHVVPAKGYTDGSDDASVITDADFVVTNIKHNVEIFGLTGSYDTEAVAPISAATVQKDKIGYVNGTKITGSLQPAATDIKTGVTIANVTGTYDTEAVAPIAAGTVLDGKIGFVNGAKVTGTMPDKSGGGAYNVTVSYANNSVLIPEGYYDGTETKAVLSLVTSGSNQVYTTAYVGTQSATYVTLASATVNYPGTYKITVKTSTNASYDDLGVKVNGQLKATEDGTVTYDAYLIKGMTFLVEGYIDSIFGATLTVDVTCYINEPAVFIG